jgi:inorganic pyrophosphatase
MKIVTAGSAFIDIDAYGGCIAYAELLQLSGQSAKAVTTAPLNESVTSMIRSWKAPFETKYAPSPEDEYILIDVSDPEFFDPFVSIDKVIEIIDHHAGYEDFWTNKIGGAAHIEFIGAACTLVYERWKAAGKLSEISPLSARLLLFGIIDNTLDLKSDLTTDRDRVAYDDLSKLAQLPKDWKANYFQEYQQAIEQNIKKALRNDYKFLPDKLELILPKVIGQIIVWDGGGKEFIERHQQAMRSIFDSITPSWAMNVIAIMENKNYILADNLNVQAMLSDLMGISFNGNVASTDRLWLRKEILKAGFENLKAK